MSKRKRNKSAHGSLASRLRYARESRKIEPQSLRVELKRRKIDVSKQLLHRYESVESQNPNLNIVEGIAEITGFSAGWLLFRGPKRSWPSTIALKAARVSMDELDFHRNYPFVRPVSDALARSLETAADKAIGWMDTPPEGVGRHSHHQRLSDTLELMAASLALDDQQRAAFITLLKTLPTDS
jgi:hypothetical protein